MNALLLPKVPVQELNKEQIALLEVFLQGAQDLQVEIGCGKGKFLVARAEESPDISFLGIDRVVKWMKRSLKRCDKLSLQNLKFIKADAREVLKRIPSGSIQAFHIYFPDPWPKRRHRIRRLINESLLETLYERLKSKGSIYIATDDLDYFTAIRKAATVLEKQGAGIAESRSRTFFPHLKTNYELKFEAAGKNLHYLEITKS